MPLLAGVQRCERPQRAVSLQRAELTKTLVAALARQTRGHSQLSATEMKPLGLRQPSGTGAIFSNAEEPYRLAAVL